MRYVDPLSRRLVDCRRFRQLSRERDPNKKDRAGDPAREVIRMASPAEPVRRPQSQPHVPDKLGELLVRTGRINQAQLNEALGAPEGPGRPASAPTWSSSAT